jgi:hypothetical protein
MLKMHIETLASLHVRCPLLLPDFIYDQTVSTWHSYRLDGPGSIPGRGKIFVFPQYLDRLWGTTQPPLGAISAGIMGPRREADHSPPSSAEFKNG